MVLREFTEKHIGADCTQLTGVHENGLFFECTFDKLAGLTLKDCDLNRSKFLTKSVLDALGFTVTLNCHSFENVEMSPLLFDLLLFLVTLTKGNDEKREKLKEVIGTKRVEALSKLLKGIE